jgi:hypothetical protein
MDCPQFAASAARNPTQLPAREARRQAPHVKGISPCPPSPTLMRSRPCAYVDAIWPSKAAKLKDVV